MSYDDCDFINSKSYNISLFDTILKNFKCQNLEKNQNTLIEEIDDRISQLQWIHLRRNENELKKIKNFNDLKKNSCILGSKNIFKINTSMNQNLKNSALQLKIKPKIKYPKKQEKILFSKNNNNSVKNKCNLERFINPSLSESCKNMSNTNYFISQQEINKSWKFSNNKKTDVIQPSIRKEMELFIDKISIKEVANKKLQQKINLENIIKTDTTLNTVYKKCLNEIKVADRVAQLINNKIVLNNSPNIKIKNKNLRNKDDIDLFTDVTSELSNKVFIYDNNGQGKFVSRKGDNKSNIDVVTKISNKFAFINKKYLIKNFFKENIIKINIKKLQEKRDQNHLIIENYIEESNKKKEKLIAKIDKKISNLHKDKNSTDNAVSYFNLDFLEVNNKIPIIKAKSMTDMKILIPPQTKKLL